MPRDYNDSKAKTRSGRRRGSMFIGILIGLLLGLSIALAVAWYINKIPSPWNKEKERAPKAPPAKAAPAAKTETPGAADKGPRWTYPEILKGEGNAEKGARAPEKPSTPAPKEAFFLQAGAFQNAPDADNLKARLALVNIEASIQTTNVPDKGVLHRVRIGPYADVDELNRIRAILKQNGIDAALVKVREAEK
jgi:cell division protein FtsN